MNFMKLGIAAAVGGVDEMLEYFDSTAETLRTGHFKTWRDYGRIAMPVAGVALQMWKPRGRMGDLGETIAMASTPLLTKSIIKMARSSAYAGQYSGPRMARMGSGPARRVSGPTGVLMHQSEFKNTRVL